MILKNFRFIAFITFGILIIGRILISGTGYLEDTDEFPYLSIIKNFDSVISFDISYWAKIVTAEDGNPPSILIRMVQTCFAKVYCSFFNIPISDRRPMMILGAFNVLTSVLILYVFYLITLKLYHSKTMALSGAFLLGTLINTNLYIRHILPYDTGLLFQLISLNILLRSDKSYSNTLFAGFFSAIGFTNYIGYFMFVFINFGLLVSSHIRSLRSVIKQSATFIMPFIILLSIFEIGARSVGTSYINYLLEFSNTINQGSFSEGLSYVFIYFHLIEKWWGIILLVLFFAGGVVAVSNRETSQAKLLFFLSACAYVMYGSYVYFFEKMVFYGRILHMYYPFIIIGVLFFIEKQRCFSANKFSFFLVLIAFINYGFVINDLNNISYPRNLILKEKLFKDKGRVSLKYDSNIAPGISYEEREIMQMVNFGQSKLCDGEYLLLNFCFFQHHPDEFIQTYKEYKLRENDKIILEKNHFMSHPAYTMEYCSKKGRKFFIDKQLKLKVIKLGNGDTIAANLKLPNK